jgi:MoaE-MoaD fusion protein
VRVRVLFFASYAEAFGRAEQSLELPAGASVGDAVAMLKREPAAARLPPSPLVAVNQRYARPDTKLADGDEVALIPPVAGG